MIALDDMALALAGLFVYLLGYRQGRQRGFHLGLRLRGLRPGPNAEQIVAEFRNIESRLIDAGLLSRYQPTRTAETRPSTPKT